MARHPLVKTRKRLRGQRIDNTKPSARRSADAMIITGHWAALGLRLESNHLAIDSGCVWGRQLTAVRLEDRAVFQVDYADRRS